MTIAVVTHLNFRGQARQALDFYRSVFGGDVMAMTYADGHAVETPEQADQLMWGQAATPDGFRIMAYDVQPSLPWSAGENAFYVALTSGDAAEIQARWNGLAEGAAVLDALAPRPWSPLYGKLKDRFGVTWICSVMPG